MSQQKDELINKIITEVKDEKFRNELLREVTQTNSSSAISDTLSQLGIDPAGARAYTGFHLKSGIVIGYILGAVFSVGGLLGAITIALTSSPSAALFPAFFAFVGIMVFINANKMRKALK